DHFAPEVLRMWAREADPLDPLDPVNRPQECGEVGAEIPPVRVHVLAEQRHFLDAVARKLPYLGEDLAGAAADLAAAHGRDDAVRAHRVAPHRDLHPGLEAALAVHRQRSREGSGLGSAETAARSLAPGPEPLTEVRDRARPEGDVDERIELEQPVALGLGVAAADRDHLLGVSALEHLRVAEVGGEALVRLLADRARVEDEHVRLLLGDGLSEPELLEHALDPLGVVSVHLAAESRDVVALQGAVIVAAKIT